MDYNIEWFSVLALHIQLCAPFCGTNCKYAKIFDAIYIKNVLATNDLKIALNINN